MLQEGVPDTVSAWSKVSEAAEEYLRRRTQGVPGQRGTKGRADPPKLVTWERLAPAWKEDGGEKRKQERENTKHDEEGENIIAIYLFTIYC